MLRAGHRGRVDDLGVDARELLGLVVYDDVEGEAQARGLGPRRELDDAAGAEPHPFLAGLGADLDQELAPARDSLGRVADTAAEDLAEAGDHLHGRGVVVLSPQYLVAGQRRHDRDPHDEVDGLALLARDGDADAGVDPFAARVHGADVVGELLLPRHEVVSHRRGELDREGADGPLVGLDEAEPRLSRGRRAGQRRR